MNETGTSASDAASGDETQWPHGSREYLDTRMLLAIMEQCRRESIKLASQTVIHSPAYNAAV
jgi:hypothetical protein